MVDARLRPASSRRHLADASCNPTELLSSADAAVPMGVSSFLQCVCVSGGGGAQPRRFPSCIHTGKLVRRLLFSKKHLNGYCKLLFVILFNSAVSELVVLLF